MTPLVTAAVLPAAVTHAGWNAIAHHIRDQLVSFTLISGGVVPHRRRGHRHPLLQGTLRRPQNRGGGRDGGGHRADAASGVSRRGDPRVHVRRAHPTRCDQSHA
ncbi:hypothetical protein CGZ69_31605 [Streptomyces peucetius subsp. caesius ATCC 27952]|nr:hypothetical protein CGZ69_31605 [Streptomyces peucetius subsp. caesius ATCC 27952]